MEKMILSYASLPILSILTYLPLFGVLIILMLRSANSIKFTAFLFTFINFLLSIPLLVYFDRTSYKFQFVEIYNWVEAWNLKYSVGVDGISILFILLSTLISLLSVLVSWSAIDKEEKLFYSCLLVIETAMIGVFTAMNLVLFYIFWEIILIPMFLLIGIWGSYNRIYAAIKFVLFTLIGSVLMLIGIIVLYHEGGKTFEILELMGKRFPVDLQIWLFLAFFAAFAVKVPMFPVHTWLPDAHTEAPTAGSVILAGVLLKMGGYGFLRFSIPFFPDATQIFMLPMLILSLLAIIYGAFVTLTQTDIKRLIAYSSVSHMGFVTLGIFSLNQVGIEGGILQMINHGIITGALFMCIGIIYERTHTRQIADYGGIGKIVPIYTVFFTIFALASSGFPGLNSFVGEFLIISGAFKTNVTISAFTIIGLLLGVGYTFWLYYRIFMNETNEKTASHLYDLNLRETLILLPMVVLAFYIGLQPMNLLDYMSESVKYLLDNYYLSITNIAESNVLNGVIR